MADEEKEKQEKLAAAKKRFEQLKKEQKKGKKGGKKKDKEAESTTESKADDGANAEEPNEPAPSEEQGKAPEEHENAEAEDTVGEDAAPAKPTSLSKQSRQRSESFRQGAGGAEGQDLFRKQAARIEELEKENRAHKEEQDEGAARLAKAEEELESLREGSSDLAEVRSKAQEAEKLREELASTQRQLTQAQQASKGNTRRQSDKSPDVTEQLASKTSTIESIELEISSLRNQVTTLETTVSERDASVKDHEERVKAAEAATTSAKEELDALKVSISMPSKETEDASEDPEALTKRITVLESDLRTANTNLDAASTRATSLESKIEALTKLHREATTTSQTKDKELSDLRAQLQTRNRPSHVHDTSEFELNDDETETGTLQTRIRALEAENFDLRRGVWRDKRAELQPGIHDEAVYEDVDIHGAASPHADRRGSLPRQGSTFQDVITSGISAFTGRPPRGSHGQGAAGHARGQSLGLLDEDEGDFDPEAFRLAQEEEAKRRVERVKEVKRGLDDWKGWRVGLAEIRRQAEGQHPEMGPVFEV